MSYYSKIKQQFLDNKTYHEVKDYSKKLTKELGKEYGITNLKRMCQFYLVFQKGAPAEHQLTWSHYKNSYKKLFFFF